MSSAENPFHEWVQLEQPRLGTRVTFATDDFFAAKERLIQPAEPVFIDDKYDDHGKWMDGWESRRRRTPGYDYCIVRLGVPGGFVPAGAEPASWRDRQYILLELKAVDPADDARYELWVNPDSMLIERITGRQTLPDGAHYQTTLTITPTRVDAGPIASGD